ncbi:tRNA uridine-5-carboxymethylaminomethyl(34) synthesis GTPase MnmE [Sphingomonas jaspsi]|uniref:tRNA uridine-5-carboxymethylaminomethyl(34) synthesis GTPase MnmE n=1 Tax=Sphingomonas jaspsi TaxID=392409 RepID=UPI0004B41599|nr:tRNA uridine-5-carboxymethylaminomethyl(34) synthesis GTPase MnmE [Sphingomonas jaspsi]
MPPTEAADTIVALSSGRPPAGIGVIRCSGPQAFAAAQALAGSLPEPRLASLRHIRRPGSDMLLDEALVIAFPGPRTATGEDLVEFHCHGGRATVDAVLAALVEQPGCRIAQPGEFTRRALVNGRIDLTEAEGLADLLAAETEVQRRSAMARAGGAFRRRLDEWRERLLALSAQAEVAIDYADEEDGETAPDLRPAIAHLRQEIALLLTAPRVEPLRDGVRVVVAGPTNAGKSSLINRIVGYDKAIVTPIAGTTRDVIEIPVSIGGIPFLLVDTAGLRATGDEVEAIGIRRAKEQIEQADILVWLGSPCEKPAGAIQVASKSDLAQPAERGGLRLSSVSGEGVQELIAEVRQRAAALMPKGDELTLDRRQFRLLGDAEAALTRAASLSDALLVAEELRTARVAIDAISGRAGVEDLLDSLFGKFCLGK